MKKFNSELKEYEALEKQLMALFRSGVYISAKDVQNIASQCGYDMPLKEREIALRNLLNKAKKEKNIDQVFDGIEQVIDEKVAQYQEYAKAYPNAQPIINTWKQKAKNSKMVIFSERKRVKELAQKRAEDGE